MHCEPFLHRVSWPPQELVSYTFFSIVTFFCEIARGRVRCCLTGYLPCNQTVCKGIVSDLNMHEMVVLNAPTDKKSALKSDVAITILAAAAGQSSEFSTKIDPLSSVDF